MGDSAFVGQNQLFPFSTVVFTSWDFHLTDIAASRNLRSSIRNQLKEMVNDAALDDVVHSLRARALSALGKARARARAQPMRGRATAGRPQRGVRRHGALRRARAGRAGGGHRDRVAGAAGHRRKPYRP